MENKIKCNKAKCLNCGDIIESKTVHNYVECSCGNLAVDGGKDYLKRGVRDINKFEDLNEFEGEENEKRQN